MNDKKHFLNLFSLSNLAMLADWLEETGELYVDTYWPHSSSSGTAYFIHSLYNLRSLVLAQTSHEIVFTIFRSMQFPIRGRVDQQFVELALGQIPDGTYYAIIYLNAYPEPCRYCGNGNNHLELQTELMALDGELVAVGAEPDIEKPQPESNVLTVSVLAANQFQIQRSHDFYLPYAQNPQHYQWIADFWQE